VSEPAFPLFSEGPAHVCLRRCFLCSHLLVLRFTNPSKASASSHCLPEVLIQSSSFGSSEAVIGTGSRDVVFPGH
ncbi:hypothetical protein LDENG_00107240, partial [Lucifuga dentata]